MTADELWRHLPGGREESVHLADFPRNLESWSDAALQATWERLMAIRAAVTAAIEVERQRKLVGTSLEAHVTVRATGEALALLERYRDDLPMLFIVSKVSLEKAQDGEDLTVTVTRVDGTKCVRCWRYVTSVAAEGEYTGLCDRCIEAVSEPAGAWSH